MKVRNPEWSRESVKAVRWVGCKMGHFGVHRNNFGRMRFLMPPVTYMGDSGSQTWVRWLCFHHRAMAAAVLYNSWLYWYICLLSCVCYGHVVSSLFGVAKCRGKRPGFLRADHGDIYQPRTNCRHVCRWFGATGPRTGCQSVLDLMLLLMPWF